MSLCLAIQEISEKIIWDLLKKQYVNQHKIREETVTDNIFLELKQNWQDKIDLEIYQFNNIEESKKGADFEWWIETDTHRIGLRVQSKILFLSGNYESLYHLVGKKERLQTEILLEEAEKDKLIPIYSFYNYFPKELTDKMTSNCIYCPLTINSYPLNQYGWTYTFGDNILFIYQSAAKITNAVGIQQLSKPMRCLICCKQQGHKGQDYFELVNKHETYTQLDAIFDAYTNSRAVAHKSEIKRKEYIRNLKSNDPEYIKHLREGKTPANLPDVDAIIITKIKSKTVQNHPGAVIE